MEHQTFHQKLAKLVNDYAHHIYKKTKMFPREELYGVTSQLRRAGLSVALNYFEGYARVRNKVHKNFLEISYGSLKEAQYLLQFASDEKYISQDEVKPILELGDEIGAMLWGMLRKI